MRLPGGADLRWLGATILALVALAPAPLVVRREDLLNLGVVFLLSVALAQSWNIIAGLAGQVNLGHAAFFGLGCLVARTLWVTGTPIAAGSSCLGSPAPPSPTPPPSVASSSQHAGGGL